MVRKNPRKRLVAWSMSLVALVLVIGVGALLARPAADVSAQPGPPTGKNCLAEPRPDPLCLGVYVGMIRDLQAQEAAQDAKIGSLEAQVAAQGERIETLQVQMAALDARVTALQSTLGARLDAQMQLIIDLLNRVSALEAGP